MYPLTRETGNVSKPRVYSTPTFVSKTSTAIEYEEFLFVVGWDNVQYVCFVGLYGRK